MGLRKSGPEKGEKMISWQESAARDTDSASESVRKGGHRRDTGRDINRQFTDTCTRGRCLTPQMQGRRRPVRASVRNTGDPPGPRGRNLPRHLEEHSGNMYGVYLRFFLLYFQDPPRSSLPSGRLAVPVGAAPLAASGSQRPPAGARGGERGSAFRW